MPVVSIDSFVEKGSPPRDSISDDKNMEVIDLAIELRLFRAEITALRGELVGVREEIAALRSSFQICTSRIDGVEDRISLLEKKMDECVEPKNQLQDTIEELKFQLNERDQAILFNDLEISGVPETNGENVVHVITLCATALGVTVDERDIVYAERVGMVRRNRVDKGVAGATVDQRRIVVRLARQALRVELLRAARVRRGITTESLDMAGEPRRFYINERLTDYNRRLLGKAREAARRAQWRYTWTSNGRILARREDGRAAVRLRTESDIEATFGSGYV